MPTLEDIYKQITQSFTSSRMAEPKRETKRLVHEITGYGEEIFITQPDKNLTISEQKAIEQAAIRRLNGEPLSRIVGVREFWGLEFEVTPDTLDPRPDTETLVEVVLKSVTDKNAEVRILDLGTGTGCISIALLLELPNATAIAVDYSYEATQVAQQNAERHKMSNRLTVIQGSWMEALEASSFDLIVSNPPYIVESNIENLDIGVKNHDPILALSGGKNGLESYKKIISDLKIHLNHKNKAFLEIGVGQLKDLARLVDDSRLCLCDSTSDIAGIPRVVEICRGDK